MLNVQRLNQGVWGFNLLLGIGILVFSFQYLLRGSDKSWIQDIHLDDERPPLPVKPREDGDGSLKTLMNPIESLTSRRPPIEDPPFLAVLKGTLPSEKEPQRGVAFIQSFAHNAELVTYVDEEIVKEGKPFEEFRGWTLAAVAKYRAVFMNKSGQRVELIMDRQGTPPQGKGVSPQVGLPAAPGNARIGQAYISDTFKSRLLGSTEGRQVWGMDLDELDWATQNAHQIMDRDFQVAPYAGGGLRIERVSAGSIGAARGLMAGDVLREVNGQPLNSIADVRALLNNTTLEQQPGLRLTIERASRPVLIEYRPLPK